VDALPPKTVPRQWSRAESLPPIEAAVRIEHRIQQASHRQLHPIG
jgi:hypothetical protein